jgi:hypothetical protein
LPDDAHTYREIGVLDAAGGVAVAQAVLAAGVVVYALWFALRARRENAEGLFLLGLGLAFLPVVLGHASMLFAQMPAAKPGAGQEDLVRGMEQATVHTWIGWGLAGIAAAAVVGARFVVRRRIARSAD